MKFLKFNPIQKSPTDTARRDYMEFFIEAVISHIGNKKLHPQLNFMSSG